MLINEDELEQDEDMFLHQGVPFTGTAFSLDANGVKISETPCFEGFPHGTCLEWHATGTLKRKWESINGSVNGELFEWHVNGAIKCKIFYIYGVGSVYDEWDTIGNLVLHRELDMNSELGKYTKILIERNTKNQENA